MAPLEELELWIVIDLVLGTVILGTIENYNVEYRSVLSHFCLQLGDRFLHLLTTGTVSVAEQYHKCLTAPHQFLKLLVLTLAPRC